MTDGSVLVDDADDVGEDNAACHGRRYLPSHLSAVVKLRIRLL